MMMDIFVSFKRRQYDEKLNWGILGTGWIATEMAEALNRVNGEIYAVCDTTLEAAKNMQNVLEYKKLMVVQMK